MPVCGKPNLSSFTVCIALFLIFFLLGEADFLNVSYKMGQITFTFSVDSKTLSNITRNQHLKINYTANVTSNRTELLAENHPRIMLRNTSDNFDPVLSRCQFGELVKLTSAIFNILHTESNLLFGVAV
jgi:hypothetical protein